MTNSLKNILGRVTAFILFLFLIPVLLVIGFSVFIDTKKFPVYIQERSLSLDSGKFYLYKFRTLKTSKKLTASNSIFYKPELKNTVSRFGAFLRRTGLDETLQLINIIKGEMNFIGPRPLAQEDLLLMKKYFPESHSKRSQINILPGITGQWQVFGNRNLGVENLIVNDLYYYNNRSFKLNIKILSATLLILFSRKHSDAIINLDEPLFKNIEPEEKLIIPLASDNY